MKKHPHRGPDGEGSIPMTEATPGGVALAKQLRDDGLSIRNIVAALNDVAVPTARGGKWHIRTVQLALGVGEPTHIRDKRLKGRSREL